MKIRLSIAAGSGPPTNFERAGPVIRIGRDPDCELALEGEASSAVSRQHARIELSDAGATLADTGSSNGTLLNGQLLDGPAPLRVGDRIQMGYTGATLTVTDLDLGPPAGTPGPRPPLGRETAGGTPAPRVSRVVVIGSAAAVVLVLGLAVVIAVLVLRQPKESDYAQAPATEPHVDPQPPVPVKPAPPPVAADTGKQPPPPPDKKGAPNLEVKEVGSYVALDTRVSVLLRRQGEDQPWGVLRPEARVSTAQTLVSLPGYRSLLVLDPTVPRATGGVHLTLWGNLPEFSASPPVLESVVMLHAPPAGADLDFTLDRGRVVIANRKAPASPARVRLSFLREAWQLDLLDNESEVALELWAFPPARSAAAGRAVPPTCLGLFTKGRVRVKTPREELDLNDHSRVSWQDLEPERTYRADRPEFPPWWDKDPDPKAQAVKKALRSLLDWSDLLGGSNVSPEKRKTLPDDTQPLVTRINNQVADVKDPDNQDVGVLFLAALDELEPLVTLLGDPQNSNVRGVALRALQSWLSRGNQNAADLVRVLERRGNSKSEAELIVRLLYIYPPEALDKPETYEELVRHLDADKLLVRLMAWWHLNQFGVVGRLPKEAAEIDYDPTWDADRRRPAIEQWKKLVADHKVPVPPRR